MTHDETAEALAAAMRDRVAGVEAPPHFVDRALRPNRRVAVRLAAAAVVIVAAAMALAVVASNALLATRDDRRPLLPAESPSPPAKPRARPVFEATWLPPGFVPGTSTSELMPTHDGREVWIEIRRYVLKDERGIIRAMVEVDTVSGDVLKPTVEQYRGTEPDAREVTIGGRTVIHVRNHLPKGLDIYEWLEEPGIAVVVTGRDRMTDAQVRRVLLGVRRTR